MEDFSLFRKRLRALFGSNSLWGLEDILVQSECNSGKQLEDNLNLSDVFDAWKAPNYLAADLSDPAFEDFAAELDDAVELNDSNQLSSFHRQWEKKFEPTSDVEFVPTIVHSPSINVSSPLEAFLEFFDANLLTEICDQTNMRSIKEGKPAMITLNEIKVFLGINIIMNYHSVPTIKCYWSSHDDLKVPPISSAMTFDRFSTIMNYLQLCDCSKINSSQKDHLFVIRPLLQHLNDVFLWKRRPSEYLCIGESVVPYDKKVLLHQHSVSKSFEKGYKMWCLADDVGYVYKIILNGDEQEVPMNSELRNRFGFNSALVLALLKDIKEKNHKVFMSQSFASVSLFEQLRSQGIYACGSVNPNRKDLPILKSDEELPRGKFDFLSSSSGVTVFKWMDLQPLHLISNYHSTAMAGITKRQREGKIEATRCPQVAKDYLKHGGGVAKHDSMRNAYVTTDRKGTKWWHRIFFSLLDTAIVNSFVMYAEKHPEYRKNFFEFYRQVGLGLLTFTDHVAPAPVKRRRVNYSTPESVRFGNVGIHWPEFTSSSNRCQVCSRNKVVARPSSKCSHCGVHLCCNTSKNCFRIYHTK